MSPHQKWSINTPCSHLNRLKVFKSSGNPTIHREFAALGEKNTISNCFDTITRSIECWIGEQHQYHLLGWSSWYCTNVLHLHIVLLVLRWSLKIVSHHVARALFRRGGASEPRIGSMIRWTGWHCEIHTERCQLLLLQSAPPNHSNLDLAQISCTVHCAHICGGSGVFWIGTIPADDEMRRWLLLLLWC